MHLMYDNKLFSFYIIENVIFHSIKYIQTHNVKSFIIGPFCKMNFVHRRQRIYMSYKIQFVKGIERKIFDIYFVLCFSLL